MPSFKGIIDEQREVMQRLVERTGVQPMRKMLDATIADLERKLAQSISGGRSGTMTAWQQRVMLGQARAAAGQMAREAGESLRASSRTAQVESLRSLARSFSKMEQKFRGAAVTIPFEEAGRFAGLIDKRKTSLLKMHDASIKRYGARVIGRVEQVLSASMASGETPDQAMRKLMDQFQMSEYDAERIVRTETAWSANATHADGLQDLAEGTPDVMMRWSEHCDDSSGAPLDDRVAVDSIAMHGQLAKPGGSFTMPPSAPVADFKGRTQVPKGLVGMSWQYPPNRPMDRSVLSAWRQEWGISGWVWKGRRVYLQR